MNSDGVLQLQEIMCRLTGLAQALELEAQSAGNHSALIALISALVSQSAEELSELADRIQP